MSDAGRCATCRFMAEKRAIGWEDDDEIAHHTCVRIIHGNGMDLTCDPVKEQAVVVDGSGYAARLCVLPTFGCALHEPKP